VDSFSQMRVAEAVRSTSARTRRVPRQGQPRFFGAYNRVELDSQVSRFERGP
jgi:hypothetical protein